MNELTVELILPRGDFPGTDRDKRLALGVYLNSRRLVQRAKVKNPALH
jgi:hypothetical protein